MAIQTKTINGTTGSSNWTWKIEIIENSIDETNDTSSVTIKNYLGRNQSSGNSYFSGTATMDYNAGGQNSSESKTYGYTSVSAGSWVLMGSHTFDIEHNTEPMTINVGGSMSSATFSPTTASASGTMTLTEILGKLRLGVSNTWKKCKVYLGKDGVWKQCQAYLGINNTWKKGR